ncbi:MAG: protein kinase [Anaerolineae bacterium]|jgi:serine/threonine protein kinase|nr:protein kinase [Anaerolineae bacterium]
MSDQQLPESKSALIGKRLGKYELTQMLASGGMARIYKALDTNLDRVVVIKVLMRELVETDESLTERFKREAKAIAALEHDNIVRVYDYEQQGDLYYIVMNYIEGDDLANELTRLKQQGKLMDVNRALKIMLQVASALDFAHSKGIIHRDVKPSNILLTKEDKAVLTDFGLVLRQSIDKTMGTAFGTPRYISPEQALASEKSVPQSDIYSMGVVLYEILTGDMLFRADTPMGIALSHISEPPPRPRSVNQNIPVEAEREILKALDKEPLNRHRSATELVNAVKRAYELKDEATSEVPKVAPKTPIMPEAREIRDEVKKATDGPPLKPISTANPQAKESVSIPSPAPKEPYTRPMPEINKPTAEGRPATKPPLVPIAIVGGIVTLVLIGLLLSNLGNRDTTTPTDAATPANTTSGTEPTAASVSLSGSIRLEYDETVLVIRNQGSEAINLSGVILTRSGATEGIALSDLSDPALPAGECIGLFRNDSAFAPNQWNCTRLEHGRLAIAPQELVWLNRGNAPQFELRNASGVIATCNTIGRGGRGECAFDLR